MSITSVGSDASGDYVDPLESVGDAGSFASVTDGGSSAAAVTVSSTDGDTDAEESDGSDGDDGSEGVDDPDYLNDLSSSSHNEAAAALIGSLQSSLVNMTSAEALKNHWAQASSSDDVDGQELTINGTMHLDTNYRDPGDQYRENTVEFMPPRPCSDAQLAEGTYKI